MHGEGEVIVPALTWVSDITSVLFAGLKPVFVDIDLKHLGMAEDKILKAITPKTRAVFLTHILGFNALTDKLLKELQARKIPLIEDVCESHGATFKDRRLGSFGFASNFSYYYAHHMSTIEGGMVCTNDENFYQAIRMMRGHGMLRESTNETIKSEHKTKYPDLNSDFIFALPGYNMRSTEVNAVIGRNQLKRLDDNNRKRTQNFKIFLENLDGKRFHTDFAVEGSVNYAFTVLLKDKDDGLRDRLETKLRAEKVEFRRGMSGGGNQLRQPYLRTYYKMETKPELFTNTEHVHFYGYYIGNYPDLEASRIKELCHILNTL
jgi:CDP-6-deoxy-D-xylo-4-hexulose-3-dehydrase